MIQEDTVAAAFDNYLSAQFYDDFKECRVIDVPFGEEDRVPGFRRNFIRSRALSLVEFVQIPLIPTTFT